jgi:hypothetical protein
MFTWKLPTTEGVYYATSQADGDCDQRGLLVTVEVAAGGARASAAAARRLAATAAAGALAWGWCIFAGVL